MAAKLAEKREFPRYDTDIPVTLASSELRIVVRMLSISSNGALIRLDRLSAKFFDEEVFLLEIKGVGKIKASKRWRRDADVGVKFELTDSDRARLADILADRLSRRPPLGKAMSAPMPHP